MANYIFHLDLKFKKEIQTPDENPSGNHLEFPFLVIIYL